LRPYRNFTHNFFRYLQASNIAISWMFICPLGFAQSTAAPASAHVGKVLVRVRDRLNEELLPQVLVQLIHFPDGIVGEQFTGSDGGVQFSGLSVGAFTIRASRQGYEPGDAHVDLGNSDRTLQNVDILLNPRGRSETALLMGSSPPML
jgi:hypothetical protein